MITFADLTLTPAQLHAINCYIKDAAQRHAAAGEEAAQNVQIRFDFNPLGKTVSAHFDGAMNGYIVAED